jgi:hypothetical protein
MEIIVAQDRGFVQNGTLIGDIDDLSPGGIAHA